MEKTPDLRDILAIGMKAGDEIIKKKEEDAKKIFGGLPNIPIDTCPIEKVGEDLEGLDEKGEKKAFRFKNQCAMLTYSTHIDKPTLYAFVTEKWPVGFIRAAHETGDKLNPYPHTHLYVEFKKNASGKYPDWNSCRVFDYDNGKEVLHPNIKKVVSKTHKDNCKRYLAKEDPENADLADCTTSIAERVWDCETIQDALRIFPNQANAVQTLWKNRPQVKKEIDMDKLPKPWWFDFFMNLAPCKRGIHWIVDLQGRSGKSDMAHWLTSRQEHDWALINCNPKVESFTQHIKIELDKGWKPATGGFIYDMPRDIKLHGSDFYSCIENLRNGKNVCTKYEGSSTSLEIGKIVVFANFLPKITSMTGDRWKIYLIHDGLVRKIALRPHAERELASLDKWKDFNLQTIDWNAPTEVKLGKNEVPTFDFQNFDRRKACLERMSHRRGDTLIYSKEKGFLREKDFHLNKVKEGEATPEPIEKPKKGAFMSFPPNGPPRTERDLYEFRHSNRAYYPEGSVSVDVDYYLTILDDVQ